MKFETKRSIYKKDNPPSPKTIYGHSYFVWLLFVQRAEGQKFIPYTDSKSDYIFFNGLWRLIRWHIQSSFINQIMNNLIDGKYSKAKEYD